MPVHIDTTHIPTWMQDDTWWVICLRPLERGNYCHSIQSSDQISEQTADVVSMLTTHWAKVSKPPQASLQPACKLATHASHFSPLPQTTEPHESYTCLPGYVDHGFGQAGEIAQHPYRNHGVIFSAFCLLGETLENNTWEHETDDHDQKKEPK